MNNTEILKLLDKQKECLEEYGFYIHYVPRDCDESPTGTNVRTYHVFESFNHLDFQIVMPLKPDVAFGIMHDLVDRVKKGRIFETNIVYEDVLQDDMPVKFIKVIDSGRDVLRMIVPDRSRNIHREDLRGGAWRDQYKGEKDE